MTRSLIHQNPRGCVGPVVEPSTRTSVVFEMPKVNLQDFDVDEVTHPNSYDSDEDWGDDNSAEMISEEPLQALKVGLLDAHIARNKIDRA